MLNTCIFMYMCVDQLCSVHVKYESMMVILTQNVISVALPFMCSDSFM